ncbi:MAG: HIT domain-containing protein [Chloroflexi bacterium]|nr:HIT domain-containing protein [Chloroflexota bacterium]
MQSACQDCYISDMFWLRVARSKFGAWMLPWLFTHMSSFLPMKRVYESDSVLAFHHPRPSYPVHFLLVAKKAIPGVADLEPADGGLLLEIMKIAQGFAGQNEPTESGYRLILNAGAYQDVPQLHFHLIMEESTKVTMEH